MVPLLFRGKAVNVLLSTATFRFVLLWQSTFSFLQTVNNCQLKMVDERLKVQRCVVAKDMAAKTEGRKSTNK